MPNIDITEEELAELKELRETLAATPKKKAKGKPASVTDGSGFDAVTDRQAQADAEFAAKVAADREAAEAAEVAALKAKVETLEAEKAQQAETPYGIDFCNGIKTAIEEYGSGWGKKATDEFDINLPSGTRCRARKLSMEDAMSLGLLESLDMFTTALMKPILEDAEKGKAPEDGNQKELLKSLSDPEKRAKFFGTVNRIVQHTVVKPKVVLQTDAEGNVGEGEVFAGDIPFTDKMFIFNAVFGNEGNAIATFRAGQADDVATVAAVPGVQVPAE
jgi:hypothetical protein